MNPEISTDSLLWQWLRFGWTYRGISRRPKADQDWYLERIKHEMSLIIDKQLADFFLFTSDALRWGKDNGVSFGPGRGSTAASVVAWLLRITEVDPHKYPQMMFERFLDPNREDPPDIDIDCSDEERWRVRDYLANKYGPECVGQIANFIRYRGKNSLVDVARVYNVPKYAKEQVSKLIIERSGGDSRFDSTLEDTIEMFPDAKAVFHEFPDLWKATRLEGNVRGMSVHAAGLVVSGSPLTDICAIYEKNGVRVMSFDKYDAEYVDALKLDFLGLATMGMISRCLKLAGLTLDDLYAIPDDDKETIDVFRRGDVTGVFQFEGRATRLVNRDVCPDHFLHITAVNALSRPGPLFSGTTSEFVGVRHGRHKPERYHPIVDDITRDTYGQIIYQEQILKILQVIGGFGWAHLADIRRIIAKKAGEAAFNVNAERFTEGALILHGIDAETADRIWKRCVTSGTYAFNIAHAISYSLLAFWCVSGGTRIYDWDNNEYVSVSKAFKNGISKIACYDEVTGKTVPGIVKAIIRTTGAKNIGLKECIRIRTSSAKNLICTPEHLVLTPGGYVRAGDLRPGSLVAAEKRYSPMSDTPDVRESARQGILQTWASYSPDEKQARIDALNNQTSEFRSEYNSESWRRMSPEHRARKVLPWIEAAAAYWDRLDVGPCGEKTHSPFETELCVWLCGNGISHEHQVPFGGGVADFMIKGVLVEMTNGLWPVDWDSRFNDGETFQVVTPLNFRDALHWVLEEEHMRDGDEVVWDEVSWVKQDRPRVTYDIVMENDPHNFIANGIVVHNCAWLKCHYPLEFYAASLAKAADDEAQFRLMKDAMNHGINVSPPLLHSSGPNWQPVPDVGLVAGWQQIPGIGAKMGDRIHSHYGERRPVCWDDLQHISGIGPKTVERIRAFAEGEDPFGLLVTGRVLARVRKFIGTQPSIPSPTHNGHELSQIVVEEEFGNFARKVAGSGGKRTLGKKGQRVVYVGRVKARNYQDKIENIRSRTGEEAEDILKSLKRPDLLKYCALICFDETDEEVFLRINRFTFPKLRRALESIRVGHDVVVAEGNRIAGFGTPVMIDKLYVIDSD